MPKRKTFEEVKKEFYDGGFTLLEDEYLNNNTRMRFTCKKHPNEVLLATYKRFVKGVNCRCKYCYQEQNYSDTNNPLTKKCTICKKELLATNENFHKSKNGRYGLTSHCNRCESTRRKKHYEENIKYYEEYRKNYYTEKKEDILHSNKRYREKNKEFIKKYQKAHFQKNKTWVLQRKKRYYESNKEKLLSQHKEWIDKNKDKWIKQQKEYRKKNKDIIRIQNQKRRNLELSVEADFSLEEWKKCIEYFNNECAYCGKKKKLEQEHFIPLTKGGGYTIDNIIPSCKSCNCKKYNKDFFEWYPKLKYYSKEREEKILKYLNKSLKCTQ